MSFTRSLILRGPCQIQFNSVVFRSQGDITLEEAEETFPVVVSNFGTGDKRVKSISHKLAFALDGSFTNLTTLLPYRTAVVGSSVFGSDKTLTIWTVDGHKRIYKAAAVTKMPDIYLGATKPIFGNIEFTCVHAESSAWGAANSLFTDSAAAYPGDADFDWAHIVTQPYACVWGAAPFDTFNTKDGISISFALKLNPEENDDKGLFDMTFQDLEVSATLTPEGLTPTQVSTALLHQGTGAVRGRSMLATASKFEATGTGVYLSLAKANAVSGKQMFGAATRRVGAMSFVTSQTLTAGVADPLFFIGTAAP